VSALQVRNSRERTWIAAEGLSKKTNETAFCLEENKKIVKMFLEIGRG
jgi:hypothetical protein